MTPPCIDQNPNYPTTAGGCNYADGAQAFRAAALDNRYRLIRVQPGSKHPVAPNWTAGESRAVLLNGAPEENTGLLTAGLRVIDLDIDQKDTMRRVLEAINPFLPKGPLIRTRGGSPRMALIYRAKAGTPAKQSIKGDLGGIDVLGSGQQIVVDGIHPSRDRYVFRGGRSPATVPPSEIGEITEEQVAIILATAAPIIGVKGRMPYRQTSEVRNANSELMAGISDRHWFDELPLSKMATLVKVALAAVDNSSNDPYDDWRDTVWAVADAGERGCPDARQLALDWSMRGAGWKSEAAFDLVWGSFRSGGVTVGTLLGKAKNAGIDLSNWHPVVPPDANLPVVQLAKGAMPLTSLPAVPAHRKWLHGIDAARGAVTLMVAPGGRGKSSWLTVMALALASARSLLGATVFGGPKRVLFLNAEDSTVEVARKFRAAMQHHGLTDADVPGLMVAGADDCSLSLLRSVRGDTLIDDTGWDWLGTQIERANPDVVIIDPLIAAAGGVSLNDNSAAALLMKELVRLAAERECAVVVAHHTAKGRDIGSAEAAMGAVTLTNLARIVLAVDVLTSEVDALKVGFSTGDYKSVFRVVGTKQNLSRASTDDRWFRLVGVELSNADPPTYPRGDGVGVVEVTKPNPAGPAYPPALVHAATNTIAGAQVPLSTSANARARYALPHIVAAIAQHTGTNMSDAAVTGLIRHLIAQGIVEEKDVPIPRNGRGPDVRKGLVLVSPQPAATSP